LKLKRLTHDSGTGYIGSFTTVALIEAGYKVVIVDNGYNSSGEEVIKRIEILTGIKPAFYSVDLTDEAALDTVFAENPDIDNVIHFAALKVSICTIEVLSGPKPDMQTGRWRVW
jgi:UDP-glucose 4-epimerase